MWSWKLSAICSSAFFLIVFLITVSRSLWYTKSISYISCINYIRAPSFFSYLIIYNYIYIRETLTNATLSFRRVVWNFVKYPYTGERLVQWTKLIYATVQFCKTREEWFACWITRLIGVGELSGNEPTDTSHHEVSQRCKPVSSSSRNNIGNRMLSCVFSYHPL